MEKKGGRTVLGILYVLVHNNTSTWYLVYFTWHLVLGEIVWTRAEADLSNSTRIIFQGIEQCAKKNDISISSWYESVGTIHLSYAEKADDGPDWTISCDETNSHVRYHHIIPGSWASLETDYDPGGRISCATAN